MKKVSLLLLAFALLMGIVSQTAAAQSAAIVGDNSVYFVTYFANNVAAAPDATVRFVNDGSTGGNLWADFYVFDDSQELTQCCACQLTPDGLLAEDVKTQITAYPITGKVPTRGVIRGYLVLNQRSHQRHTDGWVAGMGDPHSGFQQDHVLHHRNRFLRFEPDQERADAVAEPLLL